MLTRTTHLAANLMMQLIMSKKCAAAFTSIISTNVAHLFSSWGGIIVVHMFSYRNTSCAPLFQYFFLKHSIKRKEENNGKCKVMKEPQSFYQLEYCPEILCGKSILFPNGTNSIPQNQDINKNGTTVYRNVEVVQMSDMWLK